MRTQWADPIVRWFIRWRAHGGEIVPVKRQHCYQQQHRQHHQNDSGNVAQTLPGFTGVFARHRRRVTIGVDG